MIVRRFFYGAEDGAGGGAGGAGAAGEAGAAAGAAGAGGAAPAAGAAAGGEGAAAGGGSKLPKFADQLPPEFKAQHAKDLESYADKKLGDVLGEYFTLKAKMGRALLFPDPKTSTAEEIADFKAKMGLPENAEAYEYKLEAFKDMPGLEEFVKQHRAHAYASGMNKAQAQRDLEFMLGFAKAAQDHSAAEQADAKAHFDEHLVKALDPDGKRPADQVTTEAAAIKNRMILFFTKSLGNAELAKDAAARGILHDPTWARAFATVQARLEDAPFHDGKPAGGGGEKPKRGTQGSYSPEFEAAYGGKE
ncbi:MAG TPA: hypothetical protein PLB91_06975 [Spirochaetales bacterium]|nr:hypothetical protein [Spirochaetales bacterium]HRY53004.1 hypothetical protein [Spirochaetia bacterium]